MGRKRGPERLSCRALDFLEPRGLGVEPADAAAVFASLATSRSPLAVGLELRSSASFVDTVVREIGRQWGGEQSALAIAGLVLANPTVAVKKAAGPATSLLQACLIRLSEEGDECLLVAIHAKLVSGKPRQIEVIKVDVDLIDPVGKPGEALVQLEQWHRDYPKPEKSSPENSGPRVIGWFGKPHQTLQQGWPPDWEMWVETVARVFGAEMLIAKSIEISSRISLAARADLVVVLRGGAGTRNALDELKRAGSAATGRDLDCRFVGGDGDSFAKMMNDLRGILLDAFRESELRPRDLLPGERVYHRKIRGSRHFDVFDAGSSQPCRHGAFTPWSGDKAIKGMARRYRNFDPKMLRHCDKFPNCGMYMVDASGLGDPDGLTQ